MDIGKSYSHLLTLPFNRFNEKGPLNNEHCAKKHTGFILIVNFSRLPFPLSWLCFHKNRNNGAITRNRFRYTNRQKMALAGIPLHAPISESD